MYKSKDHIELTNIRIIFPLDGTLWNKSNTSTRNCREIGFHGRY